MSLRMRVDGLVYSALQTMSDCLQSVTNIVELHDFVLTADLRSLNHLVDDGLCRL